LDPDSDDAGQAFSSHTPTQYTFHRHNSASLSLHSIHFLKMSVAPLSTLEAFHKAFGRGSEEECFAVVDFCATWCGPCKVILPVFEKIASEDMSGKVKYYKVDVNECREIASEAGISAMPTFIVYKKGSPIDSLKGASADGLAKLVRQCHS
jgi:thioredoxin 1